MIFSAGELCGETLQRGPAAGEIILVNILPQLLDQGGWIERLIDEAGIFVFIYDGSKSVVQDELSGLRKQGNHM